MSGLTAEIQTVFAEEVRRGFRRAWYRVMTLAVPVVLMVLLVVVPLVRGLLAGDEEAGAGEPGHVGLVDQMEVLERDEVIEARIVAVPDRTTGLTALLQDELSALFVISSDYLATGRVEWLHTGTGISAALSGESSRARIRSLLREAMVEGALSPEIEARFLAPASFQSILVEEDGATQEDRDEGFPLVPYIFAILLMASVLTGSGYLLEGVAGEKEDRMIEVLLTSVSPMGVMAGKVLAMGSLGLLQVVVWTVAVAFAGPRVLTGFPELGEFMIDPVLLPWVAAYFLAGYLVLSVLMAGIGAATSSYRESTQIAALVYLPAVAPMVIFLLITANPDSGLARGLSFFPMTAPVTMILRMAVTDVSLAEALASLAVTVLGGLVLLWASARVFRAGLLMYGQRMGLSSVLKALRQAG